MIETQNAVYRVCHLIDLLVNCIASSVFFMSVLHLLSMSVFDVCVHRVCSGPDALYINLLSRICLHLSKYMKILFINNINVMGPPKSVYLPI